MRLVLWDVDGTLIRAGSVARTAFDAAVERVLGRAFPEHGVRMSGKTDPQIAHEILVLAGLAHDEAAAHVPAVITHLEAELAEAQELLREGGRVLPGVPELLERLHDEPSVIQSVLTGNTAANGAVKLAAFGLDRWVDLDVAAFGSDDADRRNLVPVAVERARLRRGFDGAPSDVWVVGDTPADHACAVAGGARSILVATGRILRSELEGIGATAVLDDLSDVDAVLHLLLEG